MTIYAIGDLHMDAKNEKPMSVFGENWENHEEKIFSDLRWKFYSARPIIHQEARQ